MNYIKSFCSILLFSLFIISCNNDPLHHESKQIIKPISSEGKIITDQFIVSFKSSSIPSSRSYIDNIETIRNRTTKANLMEEYGEQVEFQIRAFLTQEGISEDSILHIYSALEAGAALKLNDKQYALLQKSPIVKSIEYDREVSLPPFSIEQIDINSSNKAQTTPCGINNAGGTSNAGSDRWIWVVDTGIDLDHPDLNVITNPSYAKSFVGGTADDCHGHGSHCAGTAAAKNNNFGVVGIAANAPVVPVRVLGCTGFGSTSGIIAGLNHIGLYDLPGDVINMSIGGYYGKGCAYGSSYRSVVQGLGIAGTNVVIAAGNSSANSTFFEPACINGARIYSVSSMNCDKTWPSFSNYNMDPVDYIATGSSVYSTYKNGSYAIMSGTSMATAHVAGICQLRNKSPRAVGTIYNSGEYYPIAKK